jgi:hypothetical protein
MSREDFDEWDLNIILEGLDALKESRAVRESAPHRRGAVEDLRRRILTALDDAALCDALARRGD